MDKTEPTEENGLTIVWANAQKEVKLMEQLKGLLEYYKRNSHKLKPFQERQEKIQAAMERNRESHDKLTKAIEEITKGMVRKSAILVSTGGDEWESNHYSNRGVKATATGIGFVYADENARISIPGYALQSKKEKEPRSYEAIITNNKAMAKMKETVSERDYRALEAIANAMKKSQNGPRTTEEAIEEQEANATILNRQEEENKVILALAGTSRWQYFMITIGNNGETVLQKCDRHGKEERYEEIEIEYRTEKETGYHANKEISQINSMAVIEQYEKEVEKLQNETEERIEQGTKAIEAITKIAYEMAPQLTIRKALSGGEP